MPRFQATRSAGRLCGRSVATTLARAGLAAIVACHDAGRSACRSGGSRCNSDAIAQPISEPDPNTITRPDALADRPAKPDALAKLISRSPLAPKPTSYLRNLQCTGCGAEFSAEAVHGVCPRCGKVLFARYDLAAIKNAVVPDDFRSRSWDMWRYRELLPIRDEANIVTLGEGMTPLLRVNEHLSIKDEGKNPTGSFKARGMAAAISKAKELGITEVALPSAGNAGSA